MKTCGIYTITNSLNNKIYVGYSQNIESRFKDHIKNLKANKHANIHLQRAWNEQQESDFLFETLEECPKSILCGLEHYWCNILNTHNEEFGYNLKLTNPNDTRVKVSEKQKQQISKTLTGRKLPQEQVEKTRKSIAKIIEDRGYWMTEEGKKGVSNSRKGVNNRPGYRHSEETLKKISKSNKGRKHSEETKKKIKEARAKQIIIMTPEWRENIKNAYKKKKDNK